MQRLAMAEYSFVSELPQKYVCQVCMTVLQEPHLTECCGQHFCKGCLESWFKRKGRKSCPHCRKVNFAHIVSKPLQRKINELKVFCSNRDKGCKAILNLEELKSHLLVSNDFGCDYVSIPCSNECGQLAFRGEMDSHQKKCTKRLEVCTHCKDLMTHDSLDDHYLICEEIVIFCHRKCGQKLRRCNLKVHEDTCPYVPVKCPFYDAGCKENLTRKELTDHVANNSNSHLMKVMASYSMLKADHDSLQATVKTVKKEFADFKSQAAVEVTRMKEVIDEPKSIVKSLECMKSLLQGYRLDRAGDKILFSIPPEEESQSPSFIVSPGYSFLVKLRHSDKRLDLSLVSLQDKIDDQLEWPMKIDPTISLQIMYNDSELKLKHHSIAMTVDTNSLHIEMENEVPVAVVVKTQSFKVSASWQPLTLILCVSLNYSQPNLPTQQRRPPRHRLHSRRAPPQLPPNFEFPWDEL